MDRQTIIIGILIVIIIILLIMNFLNVENVTGEREHFNRGRVCLYHTSWCGACTRFKPTWEQFISEKEGMDPDIQIESVDCSVDAEACRKANVTGYPTVVFHKSDGSNVEFTGNRSVEALKEFILKNK
ncbi:MAG: thioredoxin domain-containing protein 5-like protein isoform X3 [Harvfovirus sp.]|uniref:Thioredoxin domain-containing protein 5-like protein isoform X3 n=1 Tax=Harvfovirus sp. TaxID=2487768 RepID=A0A3G5A119_9VIRU|nr:MAG: thioredoxin domain-containing protein 5-like protein isoform X3 [Harvfovirus sp.]